MSVYIFMFQNVLIFAKTISFIYLVFFYHKMTMCLLNVLNLILPTDVKAIMKVIGLRHSISLFLRAANRFGVYENMLMRLACSHIGMYFF